MATKLKKLVIRECDCKIDGRNIIISLTEDQKINLKLKGLKNDGLTIPIEKLYENLYKLNNIKNIDKKAAQKHIINLHDFRSSYLITNNLDLETKIKLEKITNNLLNGE